MFGSEARAYFMAFREFAANHKSEHREAQYFAAVVSLITLHGDSLFTNQQIPALVERFNYDSDVATIFSVVNDIFTGVLHWKKCQFDPDAFLAFQRDLVQVCDDIHERARCEPAHPLSPPDCANLIGPVWKEMQEWVQSQDEDLLTLIDDFVEIGQKTRIYENCVVCLDGVELNAKTDAVTLSGHLLSDHEARVVIRGRPGGTGIRRRVLCLSMVDRRGLVGSMVHRCNNSEEEFGAIIHCDKSLCNPFFMFMLNRYVEQDREHFVVLERPIGEPDIVLLEHPDRFVYFQKDSTAAGIIKNAIERVSLIIPFVPRSVLFPVDDLCAVEIFSYSTVSYLRDIHLFSKDRKDKLPNVYPVNRPLIDYMLTKLHDLASFDKVYRFAVTGNGCWKGLHPCKVGKNRVLAALPYLFDRRVNTLVLLVNSDEEDSGRLGRRMLDPWKPPEKIAVELPFVPNVLWSLKRAFVVELASCQYADKSNTRVKFRGSFAQLISEYERNILRGTIRAIPTLTSLTPKGTASFDLRKLPENLSGQLVSGQHVHVDVKGFGHMFVQFPCKKGEVEAARQEIRQNIARLFGSAKCTPISCVHISMNVDNRRKINLEAIKQMVTRYGFAARSPKIKEFVDSYGIKRQTITLGIYSMVLAREFLLDVLRRFYPPELRHQTLEVPSTWVHPGLLSVKEIRDVVDQTIQRDCPGLKLGPRGWYGPCSIVQEARKHLLALPPLPTSYKAIPITGYSFYKLEKGKWPIDRRHRVLVAPSNEEEDAIKFIESCAAEARKVWGCCYFCDSPQETRVPATLYAQDGTREAHGFCCNCCQEQLQTAVEGFYDQGIDYDALASNQTTLPLPLPDSVEDRTSRESWPQMPLGQAMWALLADRSLAPLVQAWASGIVSETIRNTPSCVTFCPEHPETLYEAGNVTLKCGNKGCNLEYCPACAAWHQRNSCQHRWDGPKCPHCQAPTVKAGGCNHITCQRCHGHWCYYCEAGFKTADDCYQHMGHEHHWDERPSWSLNH